MDYTELLPPLPAPAHQFVGGGGTYGEDQLRAYALAALAAIAAAAPAIRRAERERCANTLQAFHTQEFGESSRLVNAALVIAEKAIRALPDEPHNVRAEPQPAAEKEQR